MSVKPIIQPRKLQSIGHSFYISLPLEWIDHHGLGKHQLLDFDFGPEDELIVRPHNDQ